MSLIADSAAGIYGAWRLARRDVGGLKYFDASYRGFWRSFMAALITLPGVLALEFLDGSLSRQTGLERTLVVELIASVIQWTAFPLVMIYVADSMDRGQHYFRFVVAYNWSQVIQMAAFVPVAIMAHARPDPVTALFSLVVMVLLLAYQAFVAHKALDVPPLAAIGIVILDMLLGGVITKAASGIAG